MAVINECKYSLLRLLSVYGYNELPDVIIYSDKPGAFDIFQGRIPMLIETISMDDIKKWRGAIDFVHKVKIEVIKHCLSKYTGKFIYNDTDTYCKKKVHEIFDTLSHTNVFFHVKEGSFSNPPTLHFKKWKKFLNRYSFASPHQLHPLQTDMWNAGVIALQNSHLPMIDKVIELTDELYRLYPRHTVEQFAFCYTFQDEHIRISAALPFIFHYWDLKEFRILLEIFFNKYKATDIKTLVELSGNILPERILSDKLKFENSGSVLKFVKKISGKNWSINNYTV